MSGVSKAQAPMSRAQRVVLRSLVAHSSPGHCEMMADTGCISYKAVDWVLDALMRRGYIAPNAHGDGHDVTDAGRAALASAGKEQVS